MILDYNEEDIKRVANVKYTEYNFATEPRKEQTDALQKYFGFPVAFMPNFAAFALGLEMGMVLRQQQIDGAATTPKPSTDPVEVELARIFALEVNKENLK